MLKRILKSLLCRRVLAGPFSGMAYISETVGSGIVPKILGTYEKELHPSLSAIASPGADWLVDVGAAEGYYAVGFLRRHPGLRVVAFETDQRGQELLELLAKRNAVRHRLEVRGRCDPKELGAVMDAHPGAGVLMDVEGAERELLDPGVVPGLRAAPILVEVHKCVDLGLVERLRRRFQSSHSIEEIPARVPTAADLDIPWLRFLAVHSDRLMRRILTERLPGTSWLLMLPRQRITD